MKHLKNGLSSRSNHSRDEWMDDFLTVREISQINKLVNKGLNFNA